MRGCSGDQIFDPFYFSFIFHLFDFLIKRYECYWSELKGMMMIPKRDGTVKKCKEGSTGRPAPSRRSISHNVRECGKLSCSYLVVVVSFIIIYIRTLINVM